ncbi:RNA polymerase subunit sigma-70 [Eubacteriales bacterium OttesenSCG-928-N13]|nr:RNA polymerase subunit sigma-70 [Eubacteriales bacterium OttesenSCG-928-N13]
MTTQQKTMITSMRRRGASYIEIAQRLGLSVNTVKSYGRRCSSAKPQEAALTQGNRQCECCGKAYPQPEHRKKKRFCSDACRLQWWQRNKALLRNAKMTACPGCGRQFMALPGQKYCCHACYVMVRFGGVMHDAG